MKSWTSFQIACAAITILVCFVALEGEKKPAAHERAVAHGEVIFRQTCAACHSVGHGDQIAPDLQGVTRRRTRAWLVTMIQRPALLLNQQDPVAVALLMKYKVHMPDMKVTSAELDDLLAYFEAESGGDVTEATVCQLVDQPQRYKGRMVRFAAEWARTPRHAAVDAPSGNCGPILVELPTDPEVRPRAHFAAIKDGEFTKFWDSAYVLVLDPKTFKKGRITATLQGRFDVAAPEKGFGHGQLYDFRLVLQQVFDVSVQKDAGE